MSLKRCDQIKSEVKFILPGVSQVKILGHVLSVTETDCFPPAFALHTDIQFFPAYTKA